MAYILDMVGPRGYGSYVGSVAGGLVVNRRAIPEAGASGGLLQGILRRVPESETLLPLLSLLPLPIFSYRFNLCLLSFLSLSPLLSFSFHLSSTSVSTLQLPMRSLPFTYRSDLSYHPYL